MSLEQHFPVFVVAVPLIAATLVALMRVRGMAWAATLLVSLFCFASALVLTAQVLTAGPISYELGGWPAPYGIVLEIDPFACLMLLLITGASVAALIQGRLITDLEVPSARQPYFYAAWLLEMAGLSGIVITGDAFNIFVFLEISSLAAYVLISAGPDRQALTATFKYLIMGTIGGTFYLIGVGLIYMMTGTLNIADMADRIADVEQTRPIYMAAGFITIGLALKAAIFPMHSWMPNAYAAAPSAVAIFLSACGTKVALYILMRIDYSILLGALPDHRNDLQFILMPLSVAGIVLGSVVALYKQNIKRLLGYSSVAQIGYITLAASLVAESAMQAGLMHMFNHAMIKAALFMAVAAMAWRLGDNEVRLPHIAGAARFMPWTFAAFVAAGLSLIGVPGTAGFISKWYLVLALMEQGVLGGILIAIVMASSLLALAYIWRLVEQAYFTQRPANAVALKEAPLALLIPLWFAVGLNVYFGLVPDFPATLTGAAAELLLGDLP